MEDLKKSRYNPPVNFVYLISQAEKLVTELEANLKPLLVQLTPDLRNEMISALDKSVSFIGKVAEYTKTHRRFIPDDMDVGELNMDFSVITTLKDLNDHLVHFSRLLNDTIILSGSEALGESIRYFNNVRRLSEKNVPGAETIYKDLKFHYEKTIHINSEVNIR